MLPIPVNNIISALQTAVSPVILISGLGLLLLTMTNRLGRAIDRARALSSSTVPAQPEVQAQLNVLVHRARLLRSAIMCAVSSALFAALLVIFLFITVLLNKDLAGIICILFIFCMLGLIGALLFFMRDVNLSLEALRAKLKA